MADDKSDKERPPQVISSPSTKITVAFPFSNIKIQEPSEQLRELAAVVADLAEQIAKLQPSAETDTLVQQTRALATKLA